jgi:tetratricopeptide (TPR) repeat protein
LKRATRARLVGLLWALVLAGCATQPATDPAQQKIAQANKEAASQLFASESTVLHATEYPVASAAEGVQRGDLAWREGKLELAVFLYVQALAFDATSAEPLFKIGAVHEQLGNRELAETAYQLGLDRQPGHAVATERLGLLYLQDGRTDEAAALFKRAIELDPKRWRSHNGLGVVADRHGDFRSAIEHYDRALEIEPGAAAVLNNRGYSRYLAGDLAGAESDLKAAIRLGAGAGAWTNLGKVQAKQGRYPEALESLTREMDIAHAYNLLGEGAMENGDYSRAVRYFESAISAAPRYFEAAQRNLALASERLLAAPTTASSKVVVADTPVISDGAVVGLVERNDRVEVLRTQSGSSLVRFRNRTGTDHLGWVPSTSLADPP